MLFSFGFLGLEWERNINAGEAVKSRNNVRTRLDEKGRLLIPKDIRERAGLEPGTDVSIEVAEKSVVIRNSKPVPDGSFGTFRIKSWPDDLDGFITEAIQRSRKQRGT